MREKIVSLRAVAEGDTSQPRPPFNMINLFSKEGGARNSSSWE